MESNQKRQFWGLLILALILMIAIGGIAISGYLYLTNIDLEKQIDRRDELILQKLQIDSLLKEQRNKNQDIVEKYISDCNIMVDGKKVSTSEIVMMLRSQFDSISKLNNNIYDLNDSLRIYSGFVEMAKQSYNTDFKVESEGNQRTISMKRPYDSVRYYKDQLNYVLEKYGIKLEVRNSDGSLTIRNDITTIDSALVLFKYYRHKITRDSSGKFIVQLPNDKK